MTSRTRSGAAVLAIVALASATVAERALAQRLSEPSLGVAPELTALLLGAPAFPQAGQGKSPGTAAMLSLLITGAGQIYNEETGKGVVMLVLGLGFAALAIDGIDEYDCDPNVTCYPWALPVGLGGVVAVKIWSVFDASAGARRYNVRHRQAALRIAPTLGLRPTSGGSLGITLLSATF